MNETFTLAESCRLDAEEMRLRGSRPQLVAAMGKYADRIEELEADVAKLLGLLKPLVGYESDEFLAGLSDDVCVTVKTRAGNLKEARAALNKAPVK